MARKILGNIDELVEGVQKKLEPLASIKLALDAEQAENARAQAEAWAETAGQSVGNTFGTHFWSAWMNPAEDQNRLSEQAAKQAVEVYEQEWKNSPIGDTVAKALFHAGNKAAQEAFSETGEFDTAAKARKKAIEEEARLYESYFGDYGTLVSITDRPDRLIKPWKEAQVELEGMDKIRASKIEDAQTKEQIAYNKRVEVIEAK